MEDDFRLLDNDDSAGDSDLREALESAADLGLFTYNDLQARAARQVARRKGERRQLGLSVAALLLPIALQLMRSLGVL